MINEYVCYICRCDKCGKEWITKTHDIPKVCPKCHSVKWNELSPPMMPKIIEPTQPIADEPKDDLAVFIAKAQAKKGIVPEPITIEAEPVDEWTGWGKEEQTYDDQTGEMRTFRRHIKTNKVKWLDAETWFG